ncbi:hypothetical protein AK812_SmicGene36700 [Symbiodinium microadriaticum]|uniref:Uncharacterized protein n=1 Tax=Symbiodinium microadriaticum TaxID=2951 RepID=A0A1Q9CI67_SYMMI|nr:hypothetical protein AK812_SmicGene36700 [Symbiodinium microadriaticum]
MAWVGLGRGSSVTNAKAKALVQGWELFKILVQLIRLEGKERAQMREVYHPYHLRNPGHGKLTPGVFVLLLGREECANMGGHQKDALVKEGGSPGGQASPDIRENVESKDAAVAPSIACEPFRQANCPAWKSGQQGLLVVKLWGANKSHVPQSLGNMFDSGGPNVEGIFTLVMGQV